MSEKDLGDGLFQLKKIFSQMPEIEMWLAVVDAEVYSVSRVKTTRDIQAKIMGGGGTVFTEVFDKLLDVGCDLIVGISDCCASFPETTPKAKVVWVTSYKEASPPFGEVIIIDRSEEEEK
jgi:predicted metal-dependent peptidase